MSRVILCVLLFSLSACGVQGSLYLPDEQPMPKRDREKMPAPYPERPEQEDTILPDVI
jgi:predicted small lipoprotein YifL